MLLRKSLLFKVDVFNLIFPDQLSHLLNVIRRLYRGLLAGFKLFNLSYQFIIVLPDFLHSLVIILAAMCGELRLLILL